MAKKPLQNFERIIRSKKFGLLIFTNNATQNIFVNSEQQKIEKLPLSTNGFQGDIIKGKWTKKTFNRAVLDWYSDLWHATN